ncbi:ABC transporter permease [Maritimibacter dapengensis]|uniref:ABC transporter permease n=1 Tax=Maritimibacter dapengensis TaxID=2836868 RepID=A0ABS6T7E1_9RHOB|nr:ABC transporter permease [Maritimibacter dapengensis]MBV7380613.1 ABC transporter permease [Maritimibacter dapengensis]
MDKLINGRINWPGIIFILLIIMVWEIWAQIADSFYFPKASAVAMTMVEDWANLWAATLDTLRRAAIGFVIALVTMLPLGIVLGRIRMLGEIVEPVLEFFRPLPPIAVVPLAIMLLGIGDAAKLVVVVWGASFPIVINTIDAVKVQDPMQARLARSLRLTTWERMTLIDLPAALPRIFAGIKLGITVALLLTVVSEIIVSTNGLGDYLRVAQSDFSMTRVMTAIIVIAILSVIVNGATNWANKRLLDWHYRRSALAGRQ